LLKRIDTELVIGSLGPTYLQAYIEKLFDIKAYLIFFYNVLFGALQLFHLVILGAHKQSAVSCVAWRTDSELASAGHDCNVRIWNVKHN